MTDFTQEFGSTDKPERYQVLFYYNGKNNFSLNNGKCYKLDKNGKVIDTGSTQFIMRPEFQKAIFCGMRRQGAIGELIGPAQLYKCFPMSNGVYAQVLDWIVRFPEKPEGDFVKLSQIKDIPQDIQEFTYARLCKANDKELLVSQSNILLKYNVEQNEEKQLEIVIKNKESSDKYDFMVFSNESNVIAFDLNTNYIYDVKINGDKAELTFIVETENQQVIFQGAYLIVTDGEEPRPEIEIYDLKLQKLYKCSQNWYQDNFWLWLEIKNGKVEINSEVEEIITKLANGETVDFKVEKYNAEEFAEEGEESYEYYDYDEDDDNLPVKE